MQMEWIWLHFEHCNPSTISFTLGSFSGLNFLAPLVLNGEFLLITVICPVIFLVGIIFLGIGIEENVIFWTCSLGSWQVVAFSFTILKDI